MSHEHHLRAALWIAAATNVAGAVLFGFPASRAGQIASFPAEVPAVYRLFTALFVLLFGAAYAYLASRPVINRPFVAFGAIGKTCAFAAMALLWLLGEVSVLAVVLLGADLLLAAVFFWCLAGMAAASGAPAVLRNASVESR